MLKLCLFVSSSAVAFSTYTLTSQNCAADESTCMGQHTDVTVLINFETNLKM